jgi:hypothetical protein
VRWGARADGRQRLDALGHDDPGRGPQDAAESVAAGAFYLEQIDERLRRHYRRRVVAHL